MTSFDDYFETKMAWMRTAFSCFSDSLNNRCTCSDSCDYCSMKHTIDWLEEFCDNNGNDEFKRIAYLCIAIDSVFTYKEEQQDEDNAILDTLRIIRLLADSLKVGVETNLM